MFFNSEKKMEKQKEYVFTVKDSIESEEKVTMT